MAARKHPDDHEEMRVIIGQAEREVLPSVELEKKEIKLTSQVPPSTVPHIVMTTVEPDNQRMSYDADRIVGRGTGLQGDGQYHQTSTTTSISTTLRNEMKFTTTETSTSISLRSGVPPEKHEIKDENLTSTPSSPKLVSRLTVEHGKVHRKEKTEEIMEFFEEQEKSLKEQFQSLPKRVKTKKPRSPSPSPVRQSIGIDHLDNLVRLMEQLGSLRDENSRLKNRCDYLESTKTLLQVRSTLSDEESHQSYQSESLTRQKKSGQESATREKLRWPRLPSEEDAMSIEIDYGDSNSEQGPKRNRSQLPQRSFSTGSLDIPSDIMEHTGESDDVILSSQLLSDSYDKMLASASSKLSKSPDTKRKSKFSKWKKVKKVLTGQQLSENISSGLKSIKGLSKGSYFRYGTVTGRELTVPPVSESRSVDSGVGSGVEAENQDVRKSTSSGDPPSPGFSERHVDVPEVKDKELYTGIWMGPPEWIEKEREREQHILKQSQSVCDSPKSDAEMGSSHDHREEEEQLLQVSLPRPQSSPALLESEDEEDEVENTDLQRSISYKERNAEEAELKEGEFILSKSDKEKKLYRTPWGRVKNIIHIRKDSVKKKRYRKGKQCDYEGFGGEELSEIDPDEDSRSPGRDDYLEGPVSRSTPKSSPVVFRQKHRDKSNSISPPGVKVRDEQPRISTSGGIFDVSALIGGVSNEFTRKLQEWEELKVKRSSGTFKDSPELSESVSYESAGAVSPEFLKKLEEWEKVKMLKGIIPSEKREEGQEIQDGDSSSDGSPDGIATPPEQSYQSINVEEIQRKLTDSFSRKMEEWEKQKYRRGGSQSYEIRDSSQKFIFRTERQKSKKSKEEKEREKYEKQREREIHRVEREQHKLEKERIRLEKERLRALEREAKIEKMKGRLSQPDMEAKFKNPVLSPLIDYKVTSDFARKLHEWEILKGKGPGESTALYLEAQSRSLQFAMEYQNATSMLNKEQEDIGSRKTLDDIRGRELRRTSSESDDIFVMEEHESKEPVQRVKGKKPPPLTLIPCFDSPEVSPGVPLSEDSSLEDNTTVTMESMTQSNISSLEKANSGLLEKLRQQEMEYFTLQEDVKELNGRLSQFREEHSRELDQYKLELMEGKRPIHGASCLETKHMSSTLAHLEGKILELKSFGEQLTLSMEGAAVGKFQTVEGEESINIRLIDLLDKMRLMLQQAAFSGSNTLEDVSKKSSALHHFEKLYSQAMQLQVQMNNLRLSQLERNKEIMNMKRHLLLQEANNLMLQADVTRREAELIQYKEYSRKGTPIKRWNTYSGAEDIPRPTGVSSQKPSILQRVQRLRSTRAAPILSVDSDSDSAGPSDKPVLKESSVIIEAKHKVDGKKQTGHSKVEVIQSEPMMPEHSTDRREEHIKYQKKKKVTSDSKGCGELAKMAKRLDSFCTITLPTATIILPKDISPHEMRVPRRERGRHIPPSLKQEPVQNVPDKNSSAIKPNEKQMTKGEPKFPELLIPEWRKKPGQDRSFKREPSIEPEDVFGSDNEVFLKEEVQKQHAATPQKSTVIQLKGKVEGVQILDNSFGSSGTSEDTLKYLSPDASPAPRLDAPEFPIIVPKAQKSPVENGDSYSDPGRSRKTSEVHMSVSGPTTPVLYRKPPHGQQVQHLRIQGRCLNIPIIPLRRIKPAQELLEDSQRYRSGHSIYLTRILKRYPMKIECRSRSLEDRQNIDKENIKEGYVKSMVQQLSREGTPDQKTATSSPVTTSTLSIQRTDSPKSKSEFVQQIVHQLSSPCGPVPEKQSSPLQDLTNGGQVRKLTEAFSSGSPQQLLTDSEVHYTSVEQSEQQRSQNVQMFSSLQSSSSPLTISQMSKRTEPSSAVPDSTISATVNFSSMPLLSMEDGEECHRERSATTSGSTSHDQEYFYSQSPSQRHKLEISMSASPSYHQPCSQSSKVEEILSLPVAHTSQALPDIKHVPRRSPKQKRRDKSEMGTIGVLCRQSMTFDLGVSIQGSEESEGELGAGARSQTLPVRYSQSSTSSQSDVENIPSTSGEKKSRKKFLDANWIQKSKRFFKVSKESRCPSLECCCSDREVMTI